MQDEHSGGSDKMSRKPSDRRLSWLDQAQTLFGAPLRMHYEDLDPNITYALRVTYTGRFRATMRLVADGAHDGGDILLADGYWVLLAPLSKGEHEISFYGVLGPADDPWYWVDVTYHITVED